MVNRWSGSISSIRPCCSPAGLVTAILLADVGHMRMSVIGCTPQLAGAQAADLRFVHHAVDDLLPHLSEGETSSRI